ncbi:MAG: nucleoside 2-deoxyribosyltransferase [Hydrogenophaga sp.]|uniref:nucleoside 2-deoxyribosyltransferase n=1 Tax=Hydrogenophaga sp. TaxID=1904254 RepID=UPI00262BC17E|nr:nucleoside 2-deoxyribosyltransferase [Hydrogenophaga sp.]MCV0439827.1 nucleoside 2-deoxyribosyltransferase [Hydrogenophaga sp.]
MVHKTVYLAGPIDGLSFQEGIEWRQLAQQELAVKGIKAMSPQRGKEYILANAEIAGEMDFCKQEAYFKDDPMSTARGILARDKFDALNCSVLLVNFLGAKRVSIGTVMEIAWAYLQGKPIIVVIEEDNIHRNHPMLRETFSYITDDLSVGLNLAKGIFEGY